MDPISVFILTKIADTIIGTLVGDSTQEMISKLQGDPTKKALKKALGEALTLYITSQPERKIIAQPLLRRKSLLAEQDIANELAQVVKFVREPNTILIGKRWRDELDDPPPWRDFTLESKLLVDYFRDELKATPTFAPVFEVAKLDAIAAHAEIAAESLASVEKLLGSLLSLMDSQFGTLAQTIAGASIGIREQIRDFSPYIAEKTDSFVGRYFLFQEIQEFIDTNSRGYFLLYGDPGIGKSAISAKLVKDHGYIHHFNIRAEGINKAGDFLRNICAQLIAVYSLEYTSLPPETTQDSGILNRLLNAVSEKMGKNGKCVIVVDALDEAENLSPQSGANVLFLPRVLPQGIFIIATLRREPKEKIQGLQNYYESHWQRIKRENGLDWFNYRLPVVLALTVMKKPVSMTLIMEYSDVNDKRKVKEVLHDFDQFLYKVEIEYDGQLTTCYRWYHASFFDFIGSKEEVAEEVVDLRKAAERVTNKMWTDLMLDAPSSKPIRE